MYCTAAFNDVLGFRSAAHSARRARRLSCRAAAGPPSPLRLLHAQLARALDHVVALSARRTLGHLLEASRGARRVANWSFDADTSSLSVRSPTRSAGARR